MSGGELTAAQSARLGGAELESWQVVDWYDEILADRTGGGQRESGPILREPNGQLRRLTKLGRLVPVQGRSRGRRVAFDAFKARLDEAVEPMGDA